MQKSSTIEQETELQKDGKRPPSPPKLPEVQPKRKRPYKQVAIAVVAAALLGVGTIGYRAYQNAQPQTDAIAELTVPVDTQTLTVRIQASGTVRPVQSVNLSPKTAGRIAQLYVEQGDKVEAGAIVARMEGEDVRAQVLQAQARRDRAQAQLAQVRAGNRPQEIAQAEARLQQAQARLAQLRSGNRDEEIAQAQARLDRAQAQLAQLEAGSRTEEIAQAQARLDRTQAQLAQLRAGNRPQEIAQAQARLDRAQVQLSAARSGSLTPEIAQAEAQIDEAEATVDLTREQVRRNQILLDEGAISQDSFDRLVSENRRAIANVDRTRERLEQLQQNRQEAIAESEAQVREARQALELQQSGARPEEIARAEAEVREARQALELQQSGARPEEIARTEAEVREARQALALQEVGARPEEILRAEAELREAEAQVEAAEVQLEDTIIRAPFAGQITQRYATEGAFVTPTTSASSAGSATSTSIVALARGLEVLAKVPEADISRIKSGQQVEIVADAYPDETFKGEVNLIAPEAIKEQDVTLFEVRIDIKSGTEQLQSGMNVDATFLGDQLSDALVVPTVAIVTNKGETGVLVPNEQGKAEFRPVTIGPTIGNQIQILEGLNAGDRVFLGLPEGQNLEEVLNPKE